MANFDLVRIGNRRQVDTPVPGQQLVAIRLESGKLVAIQRRPELRSTSGKQSKRHGLISTIIWQELHALANRSDVPDDATVSQSISEYLRTAQLADRAAAAQELTRFARWYGGDRPLRSIAPGDLERYQDQLASIGGGSNRLEPLRQFFVEARQRKLLDKPLATHVRIRRKPGQRLASEVTTAEAVGLTQSGYEQLVAELHRLETVEQPKAREALQQAYADKDFRENAPYDAAKQHLADLQRRVNDIRAKLANATIVDEQTSIERAGLGMTVVIRDLDEDEQLSCTLVGPGEIDPRNAKISIQSPVGRALNDRRVGETVEVETPAGVARYRIEKIAR